MSAQLIYSKAINVRMAKRYLRFIETFNNTGGKIKHHILPRAQDMWPEFQDLKHFSWNEALLTYRQHFVAHWLLWKAVGGSQVSAFYQMKHKDKQILNSVSYQKLMEDFSDFVSKTNTNKVVALDENGNYVQMDREVFLSSKSSGSMTNTVSCKDLNGKTLRVSKEEFETRDDLVGCNTGNNKPKNKEWFEKAPKAMASKPRVCCIKCKVEVAAHHLNRHLNGTKCISQPLDF